MFVGRSVCLSIRLHVASNVFFSAVSARIDLKFGGDLQVDLLLHLLLFIKLGRKTGRKSGKKSRRKSRWNSRSK
jgi:hypothetical protein